jgi:hypothetical protein
MNSLDKAGFLHRLSPGSPHSRALVGGVRMPGVYSEEQLQTIQEIFLRANPDSIPPLEEIHEAAEWFQWARPYDENKPDKTEKKKLEQ